MEAVWTSVDAQKLALVSGQWKPMNACWGGVAPSSESHQNVPLECVSRLHVDLVCL